MSAWWPVARRRWLYLGHTAALSRAHRLINRRAANVDDGSTVAAHPLEPFGSGRQRGYRFWGALTIGRFNAGTARLTEKTSLNGSPNGTCVL